MRRRPSTAAPQPGSTQGSIDGNRWIQWTIEEASCRRYYGVGTFQSCRRRGSSARDYRAAIATDGARAPARASQQVRADPRARSRRHGRRVRRARSQARRRVAIKFLRQRDRASVRDRFLVEARATAQCNHENIVIIHEVDELRRACRTWCSSTSRASRCASCMGAFGDGDPMPPSRVVELMLPVARALARAHELGIVHRDLKPENVLVTSAGQVKVLDFGIAKALGSRRRVEPRARRSQSRRRTSTLTREGAMVGTLPYMSPEQMGIDDVDHRSDLWALGIMMFEMLAGRASGRSRSRADAPDRERSSSTTPMPLGARVVARRCPSRSRSSSTTACASARTSASRARPSSCAGSRQLLPGRGGRQLAEGESPYPGLTAFQEADADRFFGRAPRHRAHGRARPRAAADRHRRSVGRRQVVVRARRRRPRAQGVGRALGRRHAAARAASRSPRSRAIVAAAHDARSAARDRARRSPSTRARSSGCAPSPAMLGALLRARARADAAATSCCSSISSRSCTRWCPTPPSATRSPPRSPASPTTRPRRCAWSCRCARTSSIASARTPRFIEELSRGLVFLAAARPRRPARGARAARSRWSATLRERRRWSTTCSTRSRGTPGALPLLQFAAAKLWDARDRERRC